MDAGMAIDLGLVEEAEFEVEAQYTAAHVGSGSAAVLATPSLVAFMERLAHRMLEARLPEGQSSVGVQVQVSHLAPTPDGGRVRVRCEVAEIVGRRIDFKMQAWDEHELVGEGSHQRVVVDRERFSQRAAAKRVR